MQLRKPIQTEDFKKAKETGFVVEQSGYHQPGKGRPECTECDRTTGKGAYRDVTVKMPDDRVIHYYHQNPVVVHRNGVYRLDSHEHQPEKGVTAALRYRTTRERIASYLPAGWGMCQDDWQWYVTTPEDERIEFEDGMIITENGGVLK